jgi:hypothetical protein
VTATRAEILEGLRKLEGGSMPDPAATKDLIPAPEKTPVRIGVVLTTPEEIWRMATILANSELVPKAYRGKKEDIFAAIEFGAEHDMKPMQSLQSVAVIGGRPALWGDGLLAVVVASKVYRDHHEYFEVDGSTREHLTDGDLRNESTTAVATFLRRGVDTPKTGRFSIADAKRAGLLAKEGPWSLFPKRMLQMRARAFAIRDCFPDITRGIKTAEELIDIPADDAPSTPAPYVVRRRSDAPLKTSELVVDAEIVDTRGIKNLDPPTGRVLLSDDTIVIARADTIPELVKYLGTDQPIRLTTRRSPDDLHRYIDGIELLDE